ncbi:MATH and LRR domain-containing protein PFE0570w [Vespula squamosa]|uniref:MATH and LRR domain-containing protein PFE0570w n=1 Tax=Vespula squamosa TaxID=30214 RepID=A0ABD2B8D6_VESSQ
MQPSLLRFVTMIALLVNVTCIRDDLKNSRNVRSREANLIVRNSRRENSQGNTDLKMERIRKTRDREEDDTDKVMNVNEIVFDSQSTQMSRLAEKFANDALKSLKIREIINKLVNIDSSRNNTNTYSLLSVEENIPEKSNLKPKSSKSKGKKKKKRRRHRRRRKRLKHREPRWSKKASAEVDYDSKSKKTLVKGKSFKGKKSNIYSKNKIKKALQQEVSDDGKFAIDNVTVIVDVEDYIDLTQTSILNTAVTTITDAITKTGNKTERDDGKQSMIGRLMMTTTKDPLKTNSGDQGAEYADYYNDIDEFVGEIEKRPRARSVRQSYTVPSPYNDNPIQFQPEQLSSNRRLQKIRSNRNLNDNFYTYNDNFQEYQTEKDPKMDQENFDTNSLILKSSGDQYTLPLDTDEKNMYNNYGFNLGILQSGQEQNYPNNYGSLLQKNNEKYLYPLSDNTQEDLSMNNQFQLHSEEIPTPQINNNEENSFELKNPTDIYSEPYEKSFVLPSEKQQLHYIPIYKNKDQGNQLYFVNPSKIQTGVYDKNSADTIMDINNNLHKPLQKVVDISPKKNVQPVERFLSPIYFDPEEKWNKKNESKDVMTLNQQMTRRGLQKRVKNMKDKLNVYKHLSTAKKKEELGKEFIERKNGIRNRNSVEQDVANVHHVDFAITVNETKEVADQILNRIVDELEEIKMDHSTDKNNEGLPCKLTGSWVANKAGVRLDMQVLNKSIIVTLANLIPQPLHGGLLNTTWNVTGHAPFRHGAPFSLLAYDNHTKTLAIFSIIGSCKVCQGIDTIQGVWSVANEPRDCRNFQMAIGIFNDIFRRTKLLSAIKEKKKAILQSMIGNNTNTTSNNVIPKNENAKS